MRIAVISMQSLTVVNRSGFQQLSKLSQVDLYIPRRLKLLGGRFKSNDDWSDKGYRLIEFELNVFSPLVYLSFDLLWKIFKTRSEVDCMVCDFEPGTFLALILRIFCITYKIKVVSVAIDDQRYGISFKDLLVRPRFLIRNIVKRFFFMGMSSKLCSVRACSPRAIENYRALGINSKFIPLGYSSELFYYERSASCGVLKIGMLGRIVKEKGAHLLIEALGASSLEDFILVIDDFTEYGDSYRDELLALINRYSLNNKVEFVSPKHNEMGHLIRSLDVIVMPSVSTDVWQEQYGRIAVEAMACGKPVIASSCGSLPYIVDDFGLIFPEGSIADLKEILESLPSFLDQFDGPSAAKFALKHYSDYKQAKLLQEIVQGVSYMKPKDTCPELLLVLPTQGSCSHSMTIYGNQIKEATDSSYETEIYVWQDTGFFRNSLTARLHKYIFSPFKVKRHSPRIQHITDQSYAHFFNENAKTNILTVHDINPIVCHLEKLSKSVKPPFLFYYVSRYFKKFDHIITPTYTTKKYLINLLNISPDSITVVSNAVDEDKYLGLEDKFDGINILLIGSTLYKNCIASFEAIVNFAAKSDSAITIHWVVSEKLDSQMVTYFRDRNCKVVLEIYTDLERYKLIKLYRASSVLLFPSLVEGFGYPIIEALRNRLPVITSDQGAMEEIAGMHCILVNPLSVIDIERGLTKFFNSNVEIVLDEIERGYEYSLKFNNENFKRDILAIYDRVGAIGE